MSCKIKQRRPVGRIGLFLSFVSHARCFNNVSSLSLIPLVGNNRRVLPRGYESGDENLPQIKKKKVPPSRQEGSKRRRAAKRRSKSQSALLITTPVTSVSVVPTALPSDSTRSTAGQSLVTGDSLDVTDRPLGLSNSPPALTYKEHCERKREEECARRKKDREKRHREQYESELRQLQRQREKELRRPRQEELPLPLELIARPVTPSNAVNSAKSSETRSSSLRVASASVLLSVGQTSGSSRYRQSANPEPILDISSGEEDGLVIHINEGDKVHTSEEEQILQSPDKQHGKRIANRRRYKK